MKTHEIARVLTTLANFFRNGPNVELNSLKPEGTARAKPNPSEIPIALSALVSLSSFDKTQWRAVIKEYDLPIEVKAAESTRDIVGKLLRHLEKNAESRRKLKLAAQNRSNVSPELMKALDFLLRQDTPT